MALKPKFWHYFLFFIIVFLIGAIILKPATYIQSTYNGILLWAKCVLPALFPFLFLTKILTNLNVVNKISMRTSFITRKLFNCPGISNYVFLVSLISGYPVGAKLTSELYKNNCITQSDATKMCAFCSTSGPIFVIGTVGATMFQNAKIGFLIFFCHVLAAFFNGIIFRFYKKNEKNTEIFYKNNTKIDNLLSETIYDSVISVLVVGGYIALFCLLIDVLNNCHILTFFQNALCFVLNIFSISPTVSYGAVCGVIEITKGCFELSICNDNFWAIIFATGVISWGGFSTHLQALTFLKECKIKSSIYFLQKISQCFISMILCFVALKIFGV